MKIAKKPVRVLSVAALALSCVGLLAGCSDDKKGDNPVIGDGSALTASPTPSASSTGLPSNDINTTKFEITIAGGKPQGGLQELGVDKGAHVVLTVTSADTTSEIHVHGYDLKGELKPGVPAVIEFDAKIQGVFEIELEDTSVKIADLTVK